MRIIYYQICIGRDEADIVKVYNHLKEAAIAGHPIARHNLGVVELEIGRRIEQ